MQKYRVLCPHCSAGLLVTEDLLGKAGNCPGCHGKFLLPTYDELTAPHDEPSSRPEPLFEAPEVELEEPVTKTSAATVPPISPPPGTGFPFGLEGGAPVAASQSGRRPVKIEGRPVLRLLAGFLKILGVLQILVGLLGLIGLLVAAVMSPMNPTQVLFSIGACLAFSASSIPTLAYAELILVFISQEEMLRQILNEFRSRD